MELAIMQQWNAFRQNSSSMLQQMYSNVQKISKIPGSVLTRLEEEHYARQRRAPQRYQKPNPAQKVWSKISQDDFLRISSFLDAKSTASLQAVDKFSRSTLVYYLEDVWKPHLVREFRYRLCDSPSSSALGDYLQQRAVRLDHQFKNLTSLLSLHTKLYEYSRQRAGIVGCLCELACLEDPKIAAVVSRRRFMAMSTIAVDNEETMRQFKQRISIVGPSTFFPLSAVRHVTVDEETRFKFDHAPVWFEGFRGFVVQLFKFRPEHEHLRYTVYYTVFKDMMVFDTIEQLTRYNELTQRENFAVALDYWPQDDLDKTYPRFMTDHSFHGGRVAPQELLASVQTQLQNTLQSSTVVRYTY